MNGEDLYKAILEKLRVPQTVDEAVKYLENDDASQVIIEDMAGKQTVQNILVASQLVSEEDFNETFKYFRNFYTRQFAEKIIERVTKARELETKMIKLKKEEAEPEDIEVEEDDGDNDNIGKA